MEVAALKMGLPPVIADRYGEICASIAKSGRFILGPWTANLEERASNDFQGVALAYSCATDATTAVLRAINCNLLIMPAMAFSSSILAAETAGVDEILFVDADEKGIDIAEMMWTLESIKGRPFTFLLSHFGGMVYPNTDDICSLVRGAGGTVLEDFSHSWGAVLLQNNLDQGLRAGTFGDISIASLFSTKPIHSGVGAVVVDRTLTREVAPILKMMREYGRDNTQGTSILKHRGGSWRMSEMEAALFCLNYDSALNEKTARNLLLSNYVKALPAMTNFIALGSLPNGYRAFYRTDTPDDLTKFLKSKGIGLVGKVYDAPVTASPIFAQMDEHFKRAHKWCNTHICLPLYSALTLGEQEYVIESIREYESRASS